MTNDTPDNKLFSSLGARLGRYELRERIGYGGMATVYKGWDSNLQRSVAVKVMHAHLSDQPDFKTRFEREARVVASLNHPNIVQVYDFDVLQLSDQTVYYMVMALIDGQSLRHHNDTFKTQDRRVPLSMIKAVMQGVCAALDYAHGRGMLHRDVTPANILINERGEAVLADFGIARMVDMARLTETGASTGTPAYMSPEQGLGEPGDHRSDLYSLGVILYEMLNGTPPFQAESAVSVILKHINSPLPLLTPNGMSAGTQDALNSVLLQALAKSPNDRFSSAGEFNEAFLNALKEMKIRSTAEIPARIQNPTSELGTITVDSGQIQLDAISGKRAKPITNALAVSVPSLPASLPTRVVLPVGFAVGVIAVAGALLFQRSVASTPPPVPTKALAVAVLPTSAFTSSMTRPPTAFTIEFTKDDGNWPTSRDGEDTSTLYRKIENDAYHIRTSLPATAVSSLVYKNMMLFDVNFAFEAEITIDAKSQPETGTGIIFRYRRDRQFQEQYYVFAINGAREVSIWRRFAGEWTELRGLDQQWTFSETVKPPGQKNVIKIVDHGSELIGYVNGVEVVNVSEEPLIKGGSVGIYLATSQVEAEPLAEIYVDRFSAMQDPQPTPIPTVQVTSSPTLSATTETIILMDKRSTLSG